MTGVTVRIDFEASIGGRTVPLTITIDRADAAQLRILDGHSDSALEALISAVAVAVVSASAENAQSDAGDPPGRPGRPDVEDAT